LSNDYPAVASKIERFMHEAHTPSDVWPSPGETPEEFEQRLKESNVPERPANAGLF
jgi:hypothetical protein